MEKTATLNLRVSPDVKREAEQVLNRLGIPMSVAVTMYLKRIALTHGIPFPLTIPSASAPSSVDVESMSDAELMDLVRKRASAAESKPGTPASLARSELLS